MKTLPLFCLLFFFYSTIQAQDTIIEQSFPDSSFGLLGLSYAFDIQEDTDGEYVLLGATDFPTGAIRHNIRLLKVDNSFNLLWDTTYWAGAVIAQEGRAVEVLPDGGYIIVGFDQNRPFSMRITSNLDTVWTNTLSTTGGRWESVKASPQGDLLLGGWTLDNSNQIIGLIKKIAPNGLTIWDFSFSGYGIRDLEVLPDGSFISSGLEDFNGKIMKHNSEGAMLWEQTIITSKADVINDVIAGEDGSIYFAAEGSGFAGPIPYGGKLSADGNELWTSFLSAGIGKGSAVALTQGGAVALAGSLYDFWGFNQPGFLDAVDQNGIFIQNGFPNGLPDMATVSSMIGDDDGCIVLAGELEGAFYIRKDCEEVINHTNSPEEREPVQVYPNPVTELLNIKLPAYLPLPVQWNIYNAQGQSIQQGRFIHYDDEISTASFSAGVYYLHIGEEHKLIKPFVVE